MKIKLIAAMGQNRELGQKGNLPAWQLKDDLKRFKQLTKNHVVVMGRKTYESLPKNLRPLKERTTVVLTKDRNFKAKGVFICESVEEVLNKFGGFECLWIIGGGEIYKQFLELAQEMHITHVEGEFLADTYFPEFSESDWKKIEEKEFGKNSENSHPTKYGIYRRA